MQLHIIWDYINTIWGSWFYWAHVTNHCLHSTCVYVCTCASVSARGGLPRMRSWAGSVKFIFVSKDAVEGGRATLCLSNCRSVSFFLKIAIRESKSISVPVMIKFYRKGDSLHKRNRSDWNWIGDSKWECWNIKGLISESWNECLKLT